MAPSSTEQSFHNNLSQFRWARGVTDDSQPAQPTQPSNPFSRFYNAVAGDYVPLRSSEHSNEDEARFALSRWERLLGFGACLIGACVCFFFAFLGLPWLPVRPAKFVLAFSMGSLLVMVGFSVLIGPINHVKHLLSKERLPFSVIYFASLGLTLYFALGARSQLGTLLAGIVQVWSLTRRFPFVMLTPCFQVVSLVAYVLAYFPGGTQTLRFGGQIALRSAANLLPF
ncbi:ER-to-golgi vesicle protein transport Sft2 [Butyriboletus roseoflavus]|nr:ER-to-golgi vesicle protein transport Sft2 [Butyriboletus roseoflavus]